MTCSRHDFIYMSCTLTVPHSVSQDILLLFHIFDSVAVKCNLLLNCSLTNGLS